MTDDQNQLPEAGTSSGDRVSAKVVPAPARRRLIKGGLSAAPVILTLTSRPVLGFENGCMSPSRMISGNHSGFAGPLTCDGKRLSDYASQASTSDGWAVLGFAAVFGSMNPYQTTTPDFNGVTLGEIFLDSLAGHDTSGHSTKGFASYIIAAYLNAINNVGSVSTVLTGAQVVHMWNDVIGTGTYCPQINMCWDATRVIGYLESSGIVRA